MAVSTDDDRKPHHVVIRCIPFQSESVRDWANTSLAAEIEAVSDGLSAFRALRDEVASHLAIVTGSGRSSTEHPEFRWADLPLGNLKTAINGTYHAFKFAKYAPHYLADFQYRFNRRYNLRAILPRLLRPAAITPRGPNISSSGLNFVHNQAHRCSTPCRNLSVQVESSG